VSSNWVPPLQKQKIWIRYRGAKKIINIYDQQNNWQFVSPVILGIKRHLKHLWMCLSLEMSSAVLMRIHVKENLCRFYSERHRICYFHQSTLHCSPSSSGFCARTPTLTTAKWPYSVPGCCTVCRAQSCADREKGGS